MSETTAVVSVWTEQSQLQSVKKTYAKDLTDEEFLTFCEIGKATNLNPFLREIWAVKYGRSPASIFIGRDGYRKVAQNNEQYDYHIVDAVYEGDNFSVENGEVSHKRNMTMVKKRILGAYCIVKRKNSSKPVFSFVDFSEYYQGHKDENGNIKVNQNGKRMKPTLWDTKPATMIKKVAEAQGLRMAFQSQFGGTYHESENWEPLNQETVKASVEVVQTITTDQIQLIKQLWDNFWDLCCKYNGDEVNEKGELKYTPDSKDDALKILVERFVGNPVLEKANAIQFQGMLGFLDKRIAMLENQRKNNEQAKKAEEIFEAEAVSSGPFPEAEKIMAKVLEDTEPVAENKQENLKKAEDRLKKTADKLSKKRKQNAVDPVSAAGRER